MILTRTGGKGKGEALSTRRESFRLFALRRTQPSFRFGRDLTQGLVQLECVGCVLFSGN